jgi:hypothetical protein
MLTVGPEAADMSPIGAIAEAEAAPPAAARAAAAMAAGIQRNVLTAAA